MAIYMWREAIPITTAWIYHNEELWLISLSSDWSTWTTIADKNLWATSTDVSSSASYGKYYQRWNNYWFANSWSITTSSTKISQATAVANRPSWYSNWTFITWSGQWTDGVSLSTFGDMRWAVTWTYAGQIWPCGTGFHVPSNNEWLSVYNLLVTTFWISATGNNLWTYILLPKSWLRAYSNASIASQWSEWYYWANDAYSMSYARAFSLDSSHIYQNNYYEYAYWFTIRPFKNEAVQPRVWWDTIYEVWALWDFSRMLSTLQSNATTWLTELNSNATNYYNKYNSEWKIWYNWILYLLTTDWTNQNLIVDSNWNNVYYQNWTWYW